MRIHKFSRVWLRRRWSRTNRSDLRDVRGWSRERRKCSLYSRLQVPRCSFPVKVRTYTYTAAWFFSVLSRDRNANERRNEILFIATSRSRRVIRVVAFAIAERFGCINSPRTRGSFVFCKQNDSVTNVTERSAKLSIIKGWSFVCLKSDLN